MKNTRTKITTMLALIFTISLTSCEEGTTVEIPGPDIDFQFSYSDAIKNANLRNSNTNFFLIAQSDTIKGKDVESFVSNSGQDYTSVVEAATITNALLSLSENATFAGVDSIQIRYQVIGSEEEVLLAQAGVDQADGQKVRFSDVKINKAQAFELIRSNVVAKIYAIFDPTSVNCFKDDVTYRFTANTILSVKLSAMTDGVLSTAK